MGRIGIEAISPVTKKLDLDMNTIKMANDKKEQFCSYVNTYKLNMFRLAKSILHNDTDAEDVTSEAILKAYNKLDQLSSFASFKPWILKIVINEAYKLAKQRKKVMYLEDTELNSMMVSNNQTENNSQELWNIVNSLENEFRTITILFYYEDLSMKDITKILDLPIGTVKSRLARSRQKLKVLLTGEGSEY